MNNRQYYHKIHDFTKVYHGIFIYFGTEFKKSRKFFATKIWSYTVCVYIHTDIHTDRHTDRHTQTYTDTHTHTHKHMHTHKQTHTQTHTHTHTV